MKWNANQYQKFKNERLQPTLDLIHRLPNFEYNKIIDIGCGSGMSTFPLENAYPNAEIVGVDMSAEMLEKAKEHESKIQWVQRDCSKSIEDLGKFDLVFSNAFLQWLDNQKKFLNDIANILNPNGILAMQVPNYDIMPIKKCTDKVLSTYDETFKDLDQQLYNTASLNEYYNILSASYNNIQIWQTDYGHIMNSYEDIINFISSTAIRPHLLRLNPQEQRIFKNKIIHEIEKEYSTCNDGKIIFPFKRIFFIAQKT